MAPFQILLCLTVYGDAVLWLCSVSVLLSTRQSGLTEYNLFLDHLGIYLITYITFKLSNPEFTFFHYPPS